MADVTFNFITKEPIGDCTDALDRVWSVQHWVKTLDRVKHAALQEETAERQLFELHFDADGETIDKVQVLRTRRDDRIEVEHLVPPPGIASLSGAWWIEPETPGVMFASRRMTMDAEQATVTKARRVHKILRENIVALIKGNEASLEQSQDLVQPERRKEV